MNTKIRQYRLESGMTQQELAELVGVTRQTINALENSRYNPS
ncbi:MAG: helix-turn-helix transcriptional regulator, partial [Methanobrevibacter sp.]|nr:helix-turn-helix transcriptional regulator [Methanobrevibacter sp.]